MGLIISSVFTRLFGNKKEVRILITGLDTSGKTTLLYKLKLGFQQVLYTIPTVGFNVETVDYKNISFTIWDIGLYHQRTLVRHYYPNTQGLIFVVDSSNIKRISEAEEELAFMLTEDDLSDAVILVFANKQDKPNAMTVADLTKALNLNNIKNRRWHIQSSCATEGKGLYEGLDWLSNELAYK